MLVYGDARRIEDPREKAAAIRRELDGWRIAALPIERHAIAAGLLVEAGELEQGLLDEQLRRTGREAPSALADAAARLTRAVAEALLCSFRASSTPPRSHPEGELREPEGSGRTDLSCPQILWVAEAPRRMTERDGSAISSALDALLACDLPATIEVSIPEGYAFYGLYPECYLAAAEAVLASLPDGPLHVIGIRSIGTGLAAAVAVVAGPRASVASVRPVGHPFARRIDLDPGLSEAQSFAIVDEGPGLSGSSFGCVADWLEDHGVPPQEITFFPSHAGKPGPHAAERHRERWRRARRPVAELETLFAARWPLESWVADLTGRALEPLADVSAGRWRGKLCPDPALWPAADIQGERRKYLLTTKSGRWLLKFAGLGRYGREKLALARELDGLIPPVTALRHGFLFGPWLDGARPLPLVPGHDRQSLLETLAAYLSRRARLPADPRQRGAPPARLFEMLSYNAEKALGADTAEALAPWQAKLPEIENRERPVLTDNKMHAWEWLVMPDGRLLKADALDHHLGNDLVGPQDLAWDLAGAAVELDLDAGELEHLVTAVAEQSGTPRTEPLQLAFYRLAYLAFQLGRHSLDAEAVAWSEEAERLRAAAERYVSQCALNLATSSSVAS